jgi:hypothetical protein
MNTDLLNPHTVPADLMDNSKGSRIGRLCRNLDLDQAQAVGGIVMLYHWTAQHVGIHVGNHDDGWVYSERSLCLIPDYTGWQRNGDDIVLALEDARYGLILDGADFLLYDPIREIGRVA